MRVASMVLPEPGGPIMRMLWPPARTDDTKRHREIEAGAFFADVGRSEIDRDVRGGDVVTAVAECGADTVAAFAHGRVGQADGVELIFGGLDAGYVDFDFDDVGIDAIDGGAEGLIEHGSSGVSSRKCDLLHEDALPVQLRLGLLDQR